MKYGIGEILKMGSELEGEAQIKFMRDNWSPGLGKMLEYALEPEYQWDLPEGTPPYKPNTQFLDQETNLYSEVRRMYIFMKDNNIPAIKKETNFVQLLENVAPDDAVFLLHAKAKSLPYGWTAAKIREMYPGLIYETTVEASPPDLTPKTDEQLGATKEAVDDDSAVPFSEDELIAMASNTAFIPPDQLTPEQQAEQDAKVNEMLHVEMTPKQQAMAKARATRAANLEKKRLEGNSGTSRQKKKVARKS